MFRDLLQCQDLTENSTIHLCLKEWSGSPPWVLRLQMYTLTVKPIFFN